jgi:predicted flavoprotein YhiN
MHTFDAVIVGAGAAGLYCAGIAGQLGLKVLVLDHADKVAEKIRISGGRRSTTWAPTPTSAARRWRAARRPTSSPWC